MIPASRYKHVSADFSGSVYLISSDGRMLSLPIPSGSTRDPLSWSAGKRLRALAVLLFFSIVAIVPMQAPEMIYGALVRDFSPTVRTA